MITIRTYKDNGPYWEPTIMRYQAASTTDILRHCRLAMEDGEHIISVWHGDECTGLWEDEAEPMPDGEGDWYLGKPCYVLRRPGERYGASFKSAASRCR